MKICSEKEAPVTKQRSYTHEIPMVRPYTPELSGVSAELQEILSTGMLTNAKFVRKFEEQAAEFLGVENTVAVSSCTVGIIMTLKVLEITGEILVPSFTFSASGHACYWAGLKPAFVDCDLRDWTLSLSDSYNMLSSSTKAILAVHTFGNPADIDALKEFADLNQLELIFDSAHAFGSIYRGKRVGFGGHAEIFSLTPTKIITSGEGGLIATNDSSLAKELKIFRNYGDDGSYDCRFIGLNGRMSELNAILGLATLKHAEEEIQIRNNIASLYKKELGIIPGLSFQDIYRDNISSYKDFTMIIDESKYGCNRDELSAFLKEHGIATKKYFYPPLHMQTAYRNMPQRSSQLKNTDYIAQRALSLPINSRMTEEDVKRICTLVLDFHQHNKASMKEYEHIKASDLVSNNTNSEEMFYES